MRVAILLVFVFLAIVPSASADKNLGAAGPAAEPSGHPSARTFPPRASAPKPCTSAWKATRFYSARYGHWMALSGHASPRAVSRPHGCAYARWVALRWKERAAKARTQYLRWQHDEWNWHAWLPAKYYRVARCETGVDWEFDSGTYVSAFGIIRVAFPTWNGHNSPREQYEVAASIQAKYGWSAWGCGGA